MSSADEIAAVRAADLGAWLASIGLANVLHSMEEVGADAPHDLLYLEQEDIDSLNLSGEQQQKLLSAIGRIEDIEEGHPARARPGALCPGGLYPCARPSGGACARAWPPAAAAPRRGGERAAEGTGGGGGPIIP